MKGIYNRFSVDMKNLRIRKTTHYVISHEATIKLKMFVDK